MGDFLRSVKLAGPEGGSGWFRGGSKCVFARTGAAFCRVRLSARVEPFGELLGSDGDPFEDLLGAGWVTFRNQCS